jgi:hypothetical protein
MLRLALRIGCVWHVAGFCVLFACGGDTAVLDAGRNLPEMREDAVSPAAGVAPPPAKLDAGADAAAGDARLDGSSPAAEPAPQGDRSSPDAGDGAAVCEPCESYAEATLLARVQLPELGALSGFAASWRNPGVIFAHNDRARSDLYALSEQGAALAHFVFDAASVTDVEDVAVGPCPTGTCVILADIGDNQAVRAEVAILRAAEPEVVSSGANAGAVTSLAFERFRVVYEDGAHNAEGLLLDPASGALYIVTKLSAGQPSSIYALPALLDPDCDNQARLVADLSVPRAGDQPATAAASHPCGLGFALRTGNALYEFRIPAGAPFESAFVVQPVQVPAGDEPQSEAVSYWPDGRGIITSGEGASAPIYESRCAQP